MESERGGHRRWSSDGEEVIERDWGMVGWHDEGEMVTTMVML